MTQTPFYTKLKKRGKIVISGADRVSFLQSLISNDVTLLDQQGCVYSCLLTPQGKFLYDFFITETSGDALLMDCEGDERLQSLAKLLGMYRLRADVTIETQDNIDVYAIIGAQHGTQDPRHPDMGYRSFEKPKELDEKPFEEWDKHRIALTIPDGSRDMIPNKSTLSEGNIDKLNGLSYEKGCYIGQELTARMHYRGLAKKHLQTIMVKDLELDTLPNCGEPLKIGEKTIGEMRSSCKETGIALLKDNR